MVIIADCFEKLGNYGTFKNLSEYTLVPGEIKRDSANLPLSAVDSLRNDLLKVELLYSIYSSDKRNV